MRHRSKRIVIYNHKGGVGKTTLTVNIASALARLDKHVLLVDSDPQCNLTSHLLNTEVVDQLLDRSDRPDGQTLWTAVKPIVNGTGLALPVAPLDRGNGTHLLPGDIRLSEFEIVLNDLWGESFSRKARGLRGTNALSEVVNAAAYLVEADFVFYDAGPNIGPLNRIVLLDCDYFIVPAACDLFSVRALSTLGTTLVNWMADWKILCDLAPTDIEMMPGSPKFLGYIPQGFKVYRQQVAQSQMDYLAEIEKRIYSDIVGPLQEFQANLVPLPLARSRLGNVKDFGTNVERAQRLGVSLWEIEGGNAQQKDEAAAEFISIGQEIIDRTKVESV